MNPSAVIRFVTELGRLEYTSEEVATELHRLGKHGCDWPRASAAEWSAEIDRLLAAGTIELSGRGHLRMAREASSKPVQRGLF
jgi:hypothetical protein